MLTTPRDRATKHNRFEASAKAAFYAVDKCRVLLDEKLGRDEAGKNKAIIPSTMYVAKNAFSLFPMKTSWRAHVAA
jgi:hypothetical protein